MKKKFLMISALVGLVFLSCDNDDDTDKTLTLNLSGLEALGSNYVYEGWAITNTGPISTGTFSSVAERQTFQVASKVLEQATRFVITIEPAQDGDPGPTNKKILAGTFSGDTADLTTSEIGNFSNAAGSFFLRSPTDEAMPGSPNNMNDQHGVWFGTPGMPPRPNLTLPRLPAGWEYEGWVVADGTPISTGKFSAFNMADSNTTKSASDTTAPVRHSATAFNGPPIPGEDFFINAPSGVTFPLDVRGKNVVITVEPVPDNAPGPFTLKPLAKVAGNQLAPTAQTFNRNLASLPTGSVSR